MSQQQTFGTGGGGGGGDGDVKSICITENAFFSSSNMQLAAPICIFPDADGSIGFTADPPIILTALENGLNISFSGGASGGIETINTISPDSGGNFTISGVSPITVTPTTNGFSISFAASPGSGIQTINNISPDSSDNFQINVDTDNADLFNVRAGTNSITLYHHQVDFHPNDENVVTANHDDILVYGSESTGITTSRFTPQNNGILIKGLAASTAQVGTVALADTPATLLGSDGTKAVTPLGLSHKLGTQVLNSVIVGGSPAGAFTNSNVATTNGEILFGKAGSPPVFGTLTTSDGTIAANFNPTTNVLDLRATGSLPGQPNIEFIQGNDGINVPPDISSHVLKIIGNTTQGVSLTKTGTNQLTVTVADATATQKGVVLLGEISPGITTINEVLPDGSNNFTINGTAPYTVTPGTNSVSISDNGGIPYQFVPDTGEPIAVTNNSFKFKGNEPIYTQVFDFQPTNYYIGIKDATYGFLGAARLAYNEDVLGGTNSSAVTSLSLRALLGPLTKYTVLIANDNTHQIQNSSVATDGQIFFGNTDNYPDFGTLTSSSGSITISYNSGTKTMDINANVPVDSLPLVVVSAAQPLLTNNAYMFTAGSDSYSLPTTSSVNDLLELKLQGAFSYTVTQADGQNVFLGNTNTTVGTAGSFTCNGPGDWIRLRCTVANTTWVEFGMSAQSYLVN